MHAPGKPTLLVYGHHDVQPVDPLPAWHSPPFEPSIRDGRMYGRGVVDDKGQVYIHVKAIESYMRAGGGLPINVRRRSGRPTSRR
jgi:acetylornithine deacetylase/succinyl-diaminopimelate desuccinylase-like protein